MRVPALTIALLKDWVRNREAVFFAVLFPIVLLVIFGAVFASGAPVFDLAVQNHDRTANGSATNLSAALIDGLESVDAIDVERIDRKPHALTVENVERATGHTRVLVIPDGFDRAVRQRSVQVRAAVIQSSLRRITNDSDLETGSGVRVPSREPVRITLVTMPGDEASGAVESIVTSVVAEFNDRSIGIDEPTVRVATADGGGRALDGVDYYLPAFIVAMILINGLMTVPSTVATFERDGTLKRLAATPLKKRDWILATVIQQSLLAVVLTGVLVAVAALVYGVTAIPGPIAIGLIVLGAIAATAVGMVVAGIVSTPGSAVSFGGAIALPLLFVSGIFWELDLMPATLQTVAEFSPVTHFQRSLRELMILDSTTGVGRTALVLAIVAVVALWLATWLTDWRAFD
ncbi:MAG: ABC transporter permease [Halococcoides sp.]